MSLPFLDKVKNFWSQMWWHKTLILIIFGNCGREGQGSKEEFKASQPPDLRPESLKKLKTARWWWRIL